MIIKAPQIIWFCLAALSLGVSMAKHGESKNEKHNFFISLLSSALTFFLLKWGGFFG